MKRSTHIRPRHYSNNITNIHGLGFSSSRMISGNCRSCSRNAVCLDSPRLIGFLIRLTAGRMKVAVSRRTLARLTTNRVMNKLIAGMSMTILLFLC